MKTFINKKTTKNLIIIMLLMMTILGVLPNYVQAKTDTALGGDLLDPIKKFVMLLCDKVMQWLQDSFTSTESIEQENGEYGYNFQYSPAVIFSGTVPALDINFIEPNEDIRYDFDAQMRALKDEYIDIMQEEIKANYANKYQEKIDDYDKKLAKLSSNSKYKCLKYEDNIKINLGQFEDTYIFYYMEKDILYIECLAIIPARIGMGVSGNFGAKWTYSDTIDLNNPDDAEMFNKIGKYASTASELQPTIATWYKALRRIALVGLLSVLVYVGIRMVLVSSSQDKAKYKNMLKDWLVALCLLFILHFIMSITLTITEHISNIFMTGESDELLNRLRTNADTSTSFYEEIANVIMYAVLVIYTVTFTFQYLKRVLYMAFFTMIAPLITLTYPLDKIKDGQAQAFSMWIREYIFNALIQVIHLIIYSVLVSSATEIVEVYPLYAIIVIGFMTQAEKIIRKMFGFEKAETVGTLGAAATGGLIMNALNKIKAPSKKEDKGTSNQSGGNVRTAANNPPNLANRGEFSGSGAGNAAPPDVGGAISPADINIRAQGIQNQDEKRALKNGAKALKNKYLKKIGAGVIRNVARGFAGGTGAMIGLASGVAQGDMEKAFGGLVGGAFAGYHLVDNVENKVKGFGDGVKNTVNDIRDTYNTGAYGAEYAANERDFRDFRGTTEYRNLRDRFKDDNDLDNKIKIMLNQGVTDVSHMERMLAEDRRRNN